MSSKYISAYETLCPYDLVSRDDPRRRAIIAEMRAIHKAKTDEDAAAIVAWWDSWPNTEHQTALEFVRDARRLMSGVGAYSPNDAAGKLAGERERCADLCDKLADASWRLWGIGADPIEQGKALAAEQLAAEIRAPDIRDLPEQRA